MKVVLSYFPSIKKFLISFVSVLLYHVLRHLVSVTSIYCFVSMLSIAPACTLELSLEVSAEYFVSFTPILFFINYMCILDTEIFT